MDERVAQNGDQTVIIEEKISKVNGEVAIKKYVRGKLLGKGGFAKCYEVTNLETKRVLAAKIIEKNTLTKNRARQKLISEIKIHKSLHHLGVVHFEHVFEDQENVYILLEICSNQTLNELIKRRKRLTEIEVQCYILQILNTLKYLHANRVIHRDLKLGNLFLNEKMEIRLGDFGLATKLEFDGEKKRTICGTPNYIAPEILDGKTGHSYEVDIWSTGVIIYTLLIGKPPFETPDVKTTYKKIRMNSYAFPEHVIISEQAKNLITKILVLDPSKRPTLDQILAHPFMNSGGTIPKVLPLSTLACPPSSTWIKQHQPQSSQINLRMSQNMAPPQRLIDTAPNIDASKGGLKDRNMLSADRLSSVDNQNGQQSGFAFQQTQNNFMKDPQRAGSLKPSSELRSAQSTKTLPNGFMAQTGQGFQQNNIQSMNQLSQHKGQAATRSEIYVKKWVDYSSKYGLGYLLSNGSTGVFFNDSTKIILDSKSSYFEYMERKSQEKQDQISSHPLNDFPKELQKKVTLLQHFRGYLENDKNQLNVAFDPDESKAPLVYVKKWMKTRHAIMFRLSNKIVQVNFTDKTEIILSSENKMVTYVNKKAERSNYPLATALDSSNTEMAKRLKYTKEILTHMLNGANMNQVATANVPSMQGNPSSQGFQTGTSSFHHRQGSNWNKEF